MGQGKANFGLTGLNNFSGLRCVSAVPHHLISGADMIRGRE